MERTHWGTQFPRMETNSQVEKEMSKIYIGKKKKRKRKKEKGRGEGRQKERKKETKKGWAEGGRKERRSREEGEASRMGNNKEASIILSESERKTIWVHRNLSKLTKKNVSVDLRRNKVIQEKKCRIVYCLAHQ